MAVPRVGLCPAAGARAEAQARDVAAIAPAAPVGACGVAVTHRIRNRHFARARGCLRPGAAFAAILGGRQGPGGSPERAMSHRPPKEDMKKPQHTAKEKRAIKQQKKHAGDATPLIKH
jgi:hypothetical protein